MNHLLHCAEIWQEDSIAGCTPLSRFQLSQDIFWKNDISLSHG